MKVNVSGPNSINYMKLMDMAQSVLNAPDIMISDMRFGPANGIAGDLTNAEGEHSVREGNTIYPYKADRIIGKVTSVNATDNGLEVEVTKND